MKKNREFHTVRGYQLLKQTQEERLLTSAMEDYLEMIYRNSLKEEYLRINRLAELLNVKASSATKMAQKLGELGFLKYERYGIVILTEKGKKAGKYLLDRHQAIEKFLANLGIEDDRLTQAELIEHNISRKTLKSIILLNKFFENNPDAADKFRLFRKEYRESNDFREKNNFREKNGCQEDSF